MERSDLAAHAAAGLGRHPNPALECAVVVHQRGVVRVFAVSPARSGPNVGARAIALLIAVAVLAATALLFTIADWTLNTWVGAPPLARVFGEFLCGAALCRAVVLSSEYARPSGDILAAGAFLSFLFGASEG